MMMVMTTTTVMTMMQHHFSTYVWEDLTKPILKTLMQGFLYNLPDFPAANKLFLVSSQYKQLERIKTLKIFIDLSPCFFKSCYNVFFPVKTVYTLRTFTYDNIHTWFRHRNIFLTLWKRIPFFLSKLIMRVSNSETMTLRKFNK